VWPHDRAHYFFARAGGRPMSWAWRWPGWWAGLLVVPGAPLVVAVDDSLFRRSGRRVHGAGWQHDGSASSRGWLGSGTCFVTAGIVVCLPFCTRPVCLPVLARLVLPGTKARPAGRGHTAAPRPAPMCWSRPCAWRLSSRSWFVGRQGVDAVGHCSSCPSNHDRPGMPSVPDRLALSCEFGYANHS
jgi:hypothetical protein